MNYVFVIKLLSINVTILQIFMSSSFSNFRSVSSNFYLDASKLLKARQHYYRSFFPLGITAVVLKVFASSDIVIIGGFISIFVSQNAFY